jgi:hypothetical protein
METPNTFHQLKSQCNDTSFKVFEMGAKEPLSSSDSRQT